MFDKLQVISKYITGDSFEFFIKNFISIVPYLFLANNYNKYYLIITDEIEYDINSINIHLLNHSKNPEFDRSNLFIVCSNEEQELWCSKNNLLVANKYEIPCFNSVFQPSIVSKPGWEFENHQLFLEYYKDSEIQMIHLEGLEHNWNIIPYLKNNTYTFITWPCYFHKWLYEFSVNTLYTLNNEYNKKNIIWLSPDLDGILWAYEYGYHAILCNQNCFIDYTKFTSFEDTKEYDAVMNCRPEMFKRPYLAENVENLAYIKGLTYGKRVLYDFNQLTCKFMNHTRIPMEEVMKIYNKSYCGLIFSESEGACYSSSEYLLCGLPVISTLSRGGRDTWYTKKNSIIVEADKDKIKEAVKLCIQNTEVNIFNSEEIRNEHIIFTNEMRNNFIECTRKLFNKHNILINAKEYWDKTYFHLMKHKVAKEECIKYFI